MRQVPAYLLIGSGRIARHFQYYFDCLQLPYQTWSRRDNSLEQLQDLSEKCTTLLLLISDKAIAEFLEQHPFLQGKKLVHFSGCLQVEGVHAAHPLTSVAEKLLDLETYLKIPFFLPEHGPEFSDLLPGLPNPSYRLSEASRPYYHALCVLSGNFTVILWQKMFKELEQRFQIPQSAAYSYLQQIMRNLQEDAERALTGPLVRNDHHTLAANLKALENDAFQPLYQAFIETYRRSR